MLEITHTDSYTWTLSTFQPNSSTLSSCKHLLFLPSTEASVLLLLFLTHKLSLPHLCLTATLPSPLTWSTMLSLFCTAKRAFIDGNFKSILVDLVYLKSWKSTSLQFETDTCPPDTGVSKADKHEANSTLPFLCIVGVSSQFLPCGCPKVFRDLW